ncbi:hypothetical protein K0U07_02125 [bacterium]|nr:hypothetical protein [bacterium]
MDPSGADYNTFAEAFGPALQPPRAQHLNHHCLNLACLRVVMIAVACFEVFAVIFGNLGVSFCCPNYQLLVGILSAIVVIVTVCICALLCCYARHMLHSSGGASVPKIPYADAYAIPSTGIGIELTPPGTPVAIAGGGDGNGGED